MQWPGPQSGQRLNRLRHLSGQVGSWLLALVFIGVLSAYAQTPTEQLTRDLIARQANGAASTGLELEAIDAAWYNSANGDDFRFVKRAADAYIESASGTDANDARMAAQVLRLYRVTLDPAYFKATTRMRDAFAAACPGSSSASALSERAAFCADAAPFVAEYAVVFHEPEIVSPFAAALLNQAQTAVGSRKMLALVDALPYFKADDPRRAKLIAALGNLAARKPSAKADTEESSALHVYAVLKGVRLGFLPRSDATPALRAWKRMQRSTGHDAPEQAQVALLLASTEVDLAADAGLARGKTILIDGWFNSQTRKNAAGQTGLFHYKWDDYSDSGFSLLGHLFRSVGMSTGTLADAPTRTNLHGAQYYLIVSPDIPVKNPHPNYMTEHDADEVAAWVKAGGVLILMENDPPNADIAHLNLLADRFDIHFDDVLHHHVLGDHIEAGSIPVGAGGALFHEPHTFYMKDTCAISLHGNARALLRDRGDVVMAQARFGRGRVFAMVDPWLYNEYTDGRKNPAQIYAQFDNFAGGRELVRWLARQPRIAETGEAMRDKSQ